ncbi:hypothetical protein VUR80DRAFT_2662 [Thermomyces stellatus]
MAGQPSNTTDGMGHGATSGATICQGCGSFFEALTTSAQYSLVESSGSIGIMATTDWATATSFKRCVGVAVTPNQTDRSTSQGDRPMAQAFTLSIMPSVLSSRLTSETCISKPSARSIHCSQAVIWQRSHADGSLHHE